MVNDQDHNYHPVQGIPDITNIHPQHKISLSSSSFIQNKCHGLWYTATLSIPALLFVLYLGFHLKKNIKKLSHRRSHVMIAYYILLWFSAVLNLAWCSLQVWQCMPGKKVSWNMLSLLTALGTLCLEISLVAFLLQESYASGLEALAHTFMISGLIVGADIILKAIFVFGFHVPLFMDGETTHQGKWRLWTVDELLLTCTYGYILCVHYSKPYSIVVICYHTLYLPFVYVTFLKDFFQEEDLLLDNAYYSEMKDAGFFDSDWE
ncbi:Uncharacterized protein family, transmembrane-40 [Cynara cardunculus var. scolymus]|uniref:Uncharacterized protein family, transmembrane-40 n=1 Tax=Cynara cardunculus var. scolymus TaxID=59895 RepID=A0A103YCA7_CYNCS|nr:Uncharacterized protein family, transmembrane-40 [Cynara cardunculus var. scolymus]